ncbi:hypothetical protein BT63DRAFT_424121 [Microthyrium microscopicum]|uniref:Uncharacterized protein n=1 Tax=Microthyrium microscopicum TaxID=703497 RepID=A0A6A6UF34_9PEZI|nr:hypothetical protein BT63DRAFT_424121 [Microthyrium microscopicum]
MKVSVLLTISASASAASVGVPQNRQKAVLHRRQQLDDQLGYLTAAAPLLKEMKPSKIVNLQAKSAFPGAKRIKVYYGPFHVPGQNAPKLPKEANPMSLDPNSFAWNNWISGFPLDATYLEQSTGLELENGSIATLETGIYNHHLAYVSSKKFSPDFAQCAGQPAKKTRTPSTFAGATQEKGDAIFSTPDLKFKSGFYMGADDKIVATGELVNYANDTVSVFAVTETEYLPGKPEGFKDVVTEVFSVNQCDGGNLALRPPPGQLKYSLKSQNMTILHDGYVLGRRAHLHDGGEGLEFWVNDKLICDSKAIYGGPTGTRKSADGKVWETMSGVKECVDPVQVKKGDSVRLEAFYDLIKHPT